MKKRLILIITIMVCMAFFFGCGPSVEETEPAGTFCRVEAISQDGFVASADGKMIFVLYAQANQFEEYDTVVIEFSEDDLKIEGGMIPDSYEYEIVYTHVLENPKSVRPAGPGEPTFA